MKYYHSAKRQSGLAGLMFILIFPALFGLFVWAIDGARMLQSDARLTDAMEVAVLAVAAQASDQNSDRTVTAERFIKQYFSDAKNVTVTSSKQPKIEGTGSDEKRFFEYSLTVSVERDTIFPSSQSSSLSYGDNFTMGRTAVARKGLSEAVDVVLVSDYSASMYNYWGGQRKFKNLNNIVDEIADELKHYNDQNPSFVNTISVVGFDYYTSENKTYKKEEYVPVEECGYDWKGRYKCKDVWKKQMVDVTERFFAHHLVCNPGYYNLTSDCRYYGNFYQDAIFNASDINATATVANIFNLNHPSHQHNLPDDNNVVTNISVFETIPLSSDFPNVKSIVNNSGRFNISKGGGSGTASYTGLIRAAQIAETGTNPRRLIIILSDGVDSHSSVTDKLINAGLCSEIVDHLSAQVVDGKNVRAELAAIGFDYSVSSNPQMAACVGQDRVYSATDTEDIKNKILSLISEEVGNLVR